MAEYNRDQTYPTQVVRFFNTTDGRNHLILHNLQDGTSTDLGVDPADNPIATASDATVAAIVAGLNVPLGVAGLDGNGILPARLVANSGTLAAITGTVLGSGRIAVITDPTSLQALYIVIGDGVTEAQFLPRYVASDVAMAPPSSLLPDSRRLQTYYVATTGNDANTSPGVCNPTAPWATVKKGFSGANTDMGANAGGFAVRVADGTYAENSGGGYLSLSSLLFGRPVVVEAKTPGSTGVIVTNASGGYALLISTGRNITFRDITFTCASPTQAWCGRIAGSGNYVDQIAFERCRFAEGSSQTFLATATSASCFHGLRFFNCGFSSAQSEVVNIGPTLATDTVEEVLLADCTVSSTAASGYMCRLLGGSNVQVLRGTYTSLHTLALQLGTDGMTGPAITGSVVGATISSGFSHSLLLGGGGVDLVADGVTVTGGSDVATQVGTSVGFGVVLKAGTRHVLKNSTITGGGTASVYVKGAASATVTYNTITQATAPATDGTHWAYPYAVQVLMGDGSEPSSSPTVTHNKITVRNGARLFNVTAAQVSGTPVIDYNEYHVPAGSTTAVFGNVVGQTPATVSLAALQAAWVAGGFPAGTDAHSTLVLD